MCFRISTYLLFLFLLTGCVHYNYSPNLVPTPYITEKNESSLSANIGGILSRKIDVQAAYEPLKHVTLMANYFDLVDHFSNSYLVSSETINESTRIRYFDGAIGGNLPIYNSGMYFSLFLGAGSGISKNDFGLNRSANLRFSKIFLQPTLTFKSRYFRFGFATRYAQLIYTKGYVDVAIPESELKKLKQIQEYSPFYLWEEGVNVGFTMEPVTMSFSFVLAQLKSDARFETDPFDPSNMSLGLSVDLHKLYKKKKVKKPVLNLDPSSTDTPSQ